MSDTPKSLDDRLDAIYDSVLEYAADGVAEQVQQELDHDTDVNTILNEALIAAMDEVGDQFSEGSLFVPEMLMAAKAMQAGLDVLRPLLAETDTKPIGKIVLGTVDKDLHDIGKNLVAMMLEGAGFEVIDLGVSVPPEDFLTAVKEHDADMIAMSALLTTTMPNMKKTVDAFRNSGFNGRILIGGAPVNHEFATAIGADGYADDAPGAVELARQFMAM